MDVSRKLTWVALGVLTFTALMVGRRRSMPKRSVGARGFVLAIALLGLAAGPAAAVGIVGSKLQVKPATKFQFQSKDPAISPAGLNPPVDGATLTVTVNAATLTYNMPGGASWSGDTTKGWKYKNAAAPGAPGVVKIAQIKGAKIKVLTKGSMADAGGDFPLPAMTDANAVLTSGATMYCAKFLLIDAAGHNDAVKGYLNKNPSLVTGSCAGGGTTTTTMPGGGTTTTTMPAAMCEAIVPAKAIPGKYSQTSVAGPNRCGFNAAANKGGLCANDGACGGTVGSCAATPWVTVGAIPAPQPSGTGSATFFNIAAADAQCKHQACIVCGNPNLACAGIPGCTGNPS